MSKVKLTSFNTNNKQEAELLEAINNSGENFSKVTKLYWAKKLNIKFKSTKCGAKSKEKYCNFCGSEELPSGVWSCKDCKK